MWLDGKTVIITGASGGLGFAMAKLLIEKHGCTVIGVARNREKAEKAAAALGDMFSFRLFDVTDRTGWTSFARELDESGLVPDVLINNAGIMPAFARAESCSEATYPPLWKQISFPTSRRYAPCSPFLQNRQPPLS